MAQENKYTLENQKEYMNLKSQEFLKGDLKKEDIQDVWEELKKYPDKTSGLIFVLDLYSKATEHYIIPIKTLELYRDEAGDLTSEEYEDILNEISKYRQLAKLDEMLEKKKN